MKVAMQMACKLGGEPWIVALPQITGLMIIGKLLFSAKMNIKYNHVFSMKPLKNVLIF